MANKPQVATKRSLVQFTNDKKRAACVVCKLPKIILDEIRQAQSRDIKRDTILEWLTSEHGYKIARVDLDHHYSARHESL